MKKNITICILDKDIHYVKAFISEVALSHEGFSVVVPGGRAGTKPSPDCSAANKECRGADVCIRFEPDMAGQGVCDKAFVPNCGKFAGVSAILKEGKAFVFDRMGAKAPGRGPACFQEIDPVPAGKLICVYAYSGGIGASVSAIGIGRELARYRSEQVLYLSLEDIEDPGLFPNSLQAMRAEETLYRYSRLLNNRAEPEMFERLFCAAAAKDEYGLYRLAPDDGRSRLAGLVPGELYRFLAYSISALGLTHVVLDFGTRLGNLSEFTELFEEGDLFLIEAVSPEESGAGKRKGIFEDVRQSLPAVFSYCEEDIRFVEGKTEISLMNAFGLAIKDVCDRVTGDILCRSNGKHMVKDPL